MHTPRLARAHHPELLAVMISHKNIVFSAMQGFITGMLNKAVAPVGSSLNPLSALTLTTVTDFRPSLRDPPILQLY